MTNSQNLSSDVTEFLQQFTHVKRKRGSSDMTKDGKTPKKMKGSESDIRFAGKNEDGKVGNNETDESTLQPFSLPVHSSSSSNHSPSCSKSLTAAEKKRLKKKRQREKKKILKAQAKLSASLSTTDASVTASTKLPPPAAAVRKNIEKNQNKSSKSEKETKPSNANDDFLGTLWGELKQNKIAKKEAEVLKEKKEARRRAKRLEREKKRREAQKKAGEAKPLYYTEEGLPIYSAESLNIGKGGGTPDCPFDCWCCF
eukprot:g4360.t1